LISCGTAGRVPDSLTEPPPRPEIPPPGASDRQVGRFMLEQEAWADQVTIQLRAIREIVAR
jgi:hypothetical protein